MRIGIAALLLILLPAVVRGQTWRETHDKGDYASAAVLLDSDLFDQIAEHARPADVEVPEILARMHLDGLGVPQDVVLACSFASLARDAAVFSRYPPDPGLPRIEALVGRACGGLSESDRQEALERMGCPVLGTGYQTFILAHDWWIHTGSTRARVVYREREQTHALPVVCGQTTSLVRYAQVDAPPGRTARPSRHFLEWFVWTPGPNRGERTLTWQLVEAQGADLEWRTGADLRTERGVPWSRTELPVDVLHVTFTARRSGDIVWSFTDARSRGKVAPLPPPRHPRALNLRD